MAITLQHLADQSSERLIFVAALPMETNIVSILGIPSWPSNSANTSQKENTQTAQTYRFLGTNRRYLNCRSSVIINAALNTFQSGITCLDTEILAAYVPMSADIPFVELNWSQSLFNGSRKVETQEEPGWYIYVRQYETQEYRCGPYATYSIAKEAQVLFLRNRNVNAAGDPYYYEDRPRDLSYCRPGYLQLILEEKSNCTCDSSSHGETTTNRNRLLVEIEVRCPKCNCFLASYSEYRDSSSSIYVGAIITIAYKGTCTNKGYCGSGSFDWEGTVTNGKIIGIS
jgi:hypothetical protein